MDNEAGIDNLLKEMMGVLDYEFNDHSLLKMALTHPSLEGQRNYQRLEFVGDRVLGLVISSWLYEYYPHVDEGGLSSRHVALVRGETCADVAKRLSFGQYIIMADSADDIGARKRKAILADVCEAVIGALYIDGGLAPAKKFIQHHWAQAIEDVREAQRDAKTRLQEWAQARKLPITRYKVVDRTGPAHAPTFTVCAEVEGYDPEYGEGKSKRDAEQMAADRLLSRLETSKA